MNPVPRSKTLVGALVVSLMSCWCAAADQTGPTIVSATHTNGPEGAKIVNGTTTFWYPTVGELVSPTDKCTATLIGCHTVLTAAHCVTGDSNVRHYKVYFQHGGLFNLTGTIAYQRATYEPPDYNASRADVAVLKLAKAVEGITPDPINDDREHAGGIAGTIVGYGVTGGQNGDYGLKRFGSVVAAACPAAARNRDLLCWNFADKRASDTCDGDSGGPLFLLEGRTHTLISGVTSGGNATCQPPDRAFDASVYLNRVWIKSMVGADMGSAACGSVTPLQDSEKRYRGFSGQLNDATPSHEFEIQISATHQLRVGANLGKPIGTTADGMMSQPKLYVIKGKSNMVSQAVCSSELKSPTAFCAVSSPADGTYTIVLTRGDAAKIADFQLVISAF